uniref:Uncharacterized protein n=1 Tax=Kalanchoe fedtschenkoi TaxID=63787 RepID=A0A7N0RIV9_KALFE
MNHLSYHTIQTQQPHNYVLPKVVSQIYKSNANGSSNLPSQHPLDNFLVDQVTKVALKGQLSLYNFSSPTLAIWSTTFSRCRKRIQDLEAHATT